MKALDTNILVRWLIRDDARQVRQIDTLLVSAEKAGERFAVTSTVMLELVWVLGACFECSREDTVDAVEALRQVAAFRFVPDGMLDDFLREASNEHIELDDLILGLHARAVGCEATLTFDRRATRSALFEAAR